MSLVQLFVCLVGAPPLATRKCKIVNIAVLTRVCSTLVR